MKQRNASFRLILMAAAIPLLGSGCTREEAPVPAAPASTKPVAALEPPPIDTAVLSLLNLKIEKNQAGKSVLKGSISNASPQNIKFATATFKIFDKRGKEIGTATASVDNLDAKFSWTFEVEITQEGAASAKFAGFTAR